MRRILIADDDSAIRALLSRALEDEGYAVETAADGRAALEAIVASPPDLLITDLIMPRLTGWSVFVRVRQLAPALPILVVSGADAGFVRQETPLPDYAVFLRKPFAIDHLLDIVARLTDSPAEPDIEPAGDGSEGDTGQ